MLVSVIASFVTFHVLLCMYKLRCQVYFFFHRGFYASFLWIHENWNEYATGSVWRCQEEEEKEKDRERAIRCWCNVVLCSFSLLFFFYLLLIFFHLRALQISPRSLFEQHKSSIIDYIIVNSCLLAFFLAWYIVSFLFCLFVCRMLDDCSRRRRYFWFSYFWHSNVDDAFGNNEKRQ